MYTQEAINVNEFGQLHPFLERKVNSELTEDEKVIKKEYFKLVELSQGQYDRGSIGNDKPMARGEWSRVGASVIYSAMRDYKRPLDDSYMLTAKAKREATSFLFDDEDSMLDFWCYCAGRDVEKTRQQVLDSTWNGYEYERSNHAKEKG